MPALLEIGDIREVTGRRELYCRYAQLADGIERVAGRIWHGVAMSA
jgi:hypothetical protein